MISEKLIKLILSLLISAFFCVISASVYTAAAEPQKPLIQATDYYDDYYDDYYYDDGYYDDDYYDAPPDMINCILFGAIFGVVCGGISVVIVYLRYKNNGKSEPYPYNNKATLNLSQSDDLLVDTRVTHVKVHKN